MNSFVKKIYGEENSFSTENFKSPSSLYSPVYNWIWNGPITREEIDKQLDEMQQLGIKAVAIIAEPKTFRPARIPTLLEPDYLTKPYFEEYRYAMEGMKQRGMYVWFYDEGGWPSGGACGRVFLENPEKFGRKSLSSRKICVSKGDTYCPSNDVIRTFLDNDTQIESGYTFEKDCEITEYFYFKNRFEPGVPEIPDVTVPEATDKFIELTHEAYKPYIEEFLGDTILAVFTDEPTAPPERFLSERKLRNFLKRKTATASTSSCPNLWVTAFPQRRVVLHESHGLICAANFSATTTFSKTKSGQTNTVLHLQDIWILTTQPTEYAQTQVTSI